MTSSRHSTAAARVVLRSHKSIVVSKANSAKSRSPANDLTEVLATLLNDGTSPTTGAQLLKKATVDEMFRNQVPDFPNFGRQGIPAAKPDLTNAIPEIYPVVCLCIIV